MASYFAAFSNAIDLYGARDSSELRPAQRGAVWAAAGHFTASQEPAQLVLPTGAGKTAVMCLLPYLLRVERAIVVTPSRLLREQVGREFSELQALRKVGAVPENLKRPRVAQVKHRLKDAQAWRDLSIYDVIVGTPGVLSPSYDGVAACPHSLRIDLVLVDEAHHAAADTWTALLNQFPDVPQALFTATPFRRDRMLLPGKSVYEYTLGAALKDKIIEPVNFIPVKVGDEGHDVSLAHRAAQRLRNQRHIDAGSKVIVRTDRVAHAHQLVEVYRNQGVKLAVVDGELSARNVQRIFRDLKEGRLDGVAAVGVLGEGFDFPLIKIAVYHRGHKSLPATLQFVGRLTRQLPHPAPPAELLAIPHEIQDETSALYQEDADWRDLLPRIASATTAQERERVRFFSSLAEREPMDDFPWDAVKPKCQVWAFKRPARFNLHKELSRKFSSKVASDTGAEHDRIRAIITTKRWHPRWMASSKLDTLQYSLNILMVADDVLFVHCADNASVYELLTEFGVTSPHQIEPEWMQRLLIGSRLDSYFSVGMRSAGAPGGHRASYKIIAGSSVGQAITASESQSYALGHLISRQLIEGDSTSALGASIGGAKVWTPRHLDLHGFQDWCLLLEKVARAGSGSDVPGLRLPLPQTLQSYPKVPVAAVLDERLITKGFYVDTPGGKSVQLAAAELLVERSSAERCRLRLCNEGEALWEADINLHGQVTPIGDDMRVIRSDNRNKSMLSHLLTMRHPILFFADGSTIIGNQYFSRSSKVPRVRTGYLDRWNWDGVDIHSESRNYRPGYDCNIHEKIVNHFKQIDSTSWIISDDGAGEIADIIWIKRCGREMAVDLVHAKWSSRDKPGNRLADLYEVVGQADRSVRWLHPRLFWEELNRRLRGRDRRKFTKIAYCGGKENEVKDRIAALAQNPRNVNWSIAIVQPGLLMNGLDAWHQGSVLLSACEEWITQLGANFRIIGC